MRLADAEHVRAMGPGTVDVDTDDVALQVDLERAWRRLSATHQEALALAVLDRVNGQRRGSSPPRSASPVSIHSANRSSDTVATASVAASETAESAAPSAYCSRGTSSARTLIVVVGAML